MTLRFDHLHLSFGARTVLRDFSLELPEKGVICFFGASGCGKTTLLHTISGLVKPQSGSILGIENKRTAVVFQEDRLLPWVSAKQNVALVCRGEEKSAGKWLQKVGLAGEEDKKPAALSGGMKRRVAIARALAYGGDILILDEPFNGLDTNTERIVISHIREQYADKLVLFITHDSAEAAFFADEVLLLSGPPLTVQKKLRFTAPISQRMADSSISENYQAAIESLTLPK